MSSGSASSWSRQLEPPATEEVVEMLLFW